MNDAVDTAVEETPFEEVITLGVKEKTPEEIEEDNKQAEIDEAHNIKVSIELGFKNFEAGSHFSYSTIGAALCLMRDGKKYKKLGYKTMDHVIKDIGKSRSICYSMMAYHDVITPALEKYPTLANIDVTLLTKYVIPYLQANPATDEFDPGSKLEEIAALGDAEQLDEVRGLIGKVKKVDCLHEETEAWVKCKCCHKFIKVVAS